MKIKEDFKIKKNTFETEYYTTNQHKTFVDPDGFPRCDNDCDKVFAKAIKQAYSKDILKRSPNNYKFYIKIEPNKQFHNPFPNHSITKIKTSFVDKVCKSENSFIEVNQQVFDKYINFLKTENLKWLTDAEREAR